MIWGIREPRFDCTAKNTLISVFVPKLQVVVSQYFKDTQVNRTVFYYKNNEYLMKYTGTISILPKGVVALAHSMLVSSALFSLKLWWELSHHQTFTPELFLVRQPASHTTNNRGSVLLTCRGEGGRDHIEICFIYALGWLDAASQSTALKGYLKCLPAV
jgi:hypothetical protein